MKASELREKSVAELGVELITLSRQRFSNRMQESAGLMQRSHELKLTRKAIARVKTILNEKKLNEKKRNELLAEEKARPGE